MSLEVEERGLRDLPFRKTEFFTDIFMFKVVSVASTASEDEGLTDKGGIFTGSSKLTLEFEKERENVDYEWLATYLITQDMS